MINCYPNSFLVYDSDGVKVTNDFNEVRPLIDFRECSRKELPSILIDGYSNDNSKASSNRVF